MEIARTRLNDSLCQCRDDNLALGLTAKRMMTSFVKSKTRAKSSRRTCTLRDYATALQESSVHLEETINSYMAHAPAGQCDILLDESTIIETCQLSPSAFMPAPVTVKIEAKDTKEVAWICSSCSCSNIYGGEGEKLCAGCSKVFQEGDDEDESSSKRTLKQFMLHLESSVAQREASLGDVDAFFPEEEFANYIEIPSPEVPKIDKKMSRLAALPTDAELEALAIPFLEHSNESKWRDLLEESVRSTKLSNSRRKRRNACTITTAASVFPRTPRGVPLFISPLSQNMDKYMGAIFGKTEDYGRRYLCGDYSPGYMTAYDAQAFAKNEIKGLIRIAERDLRVIESTTNEWVQQGVEAAAALKKAENALLQVKHEELMEIQRLKNSPLSIPVLESKEPPQSPRSTKSATRRNTKAEGIDFMMIAKQPVEDKQDKGRVKMEVRSTTSETTNPKKKAGPAVVATVSNASHVKTGNGKKSGGKK